MGLQKEAKAAKELIFDQLKFNLDKDISVFEITIRVLGGLLGAYEMDGDKKWISFATDLADRLMPAFDTPHGIPIDSFNLQKFKLTNAVPTRRLAKMVSCRKQARFN
jgi:Glycosyl hydrolase family 47